MYAYDYSLIMTPAIKSGADLARAHAGRFRIVGYDELRSKATDVAGSILQKYDTTESAIVVAPILMGGGLPARLVVDALLGFGLVKAVVPCQMRRYTGVGSAGKTQMLIEMDRRRVEGEMVVGIDDLVDGGQTLAAFRKHALLRGAAQVDTAVIFAKPHTIERPGHCAESGVTEWLVLPGEELDFMDELTMSDPDLQVFGEEQRAAYFGELGFSAQVVADWLRLQRRAGQSIMNLPDHAKKK